MRFLRLDGAVAREERESLRRTARAAAAVLSALSLLAAAPPAESAPRSDGGEHAFEVVSPDRSGITWFHTNGMTEQRYLTETMGGGGAFLDFDADGRMDIFLVNSGPSDIYQPPTPLANALYRNNGDGTFTDVAASAGVTGGTYGMGAAAADYDNDGHADIFVTAYGRPRLYHNEGDGTFTDVTGTAGLDAAEGWTTSAAWFDYDGDGLLDLFVCSFVVFGKQEHGLCGDNRLGRRYYCIPRVFEGTPSLLFRNQGDGSFTEVGRGTAIEDAVGKALGVVATDINNDRRMDLFVANDTVHNFLFVNRGGGEWDEIGLESEVGYSADGKARSGMGVDAADFDGDGLQDLFVSNVDQEMYSLYRNNGDEWFTDVAKVNEIAATTRTMSGWGLRFFDYDNDGHLDLFLANGHPDDQVEMYGSGMVSYRERPLLYRGDGSGLEDVSARAGPAFQTKLASRGLATGDFDDDGRLDVLIVNNGEAPVLLRNTAGRGNHWLGLRLVGTRSNRDAVGAVIRWSAGGVERSRLKTSGGSYLSSHDPRELIGLGTETGVDWLEIAWPPPSDAVERLEGLTVDRYLTIEEGRGIVAAE